MTILFHGTSRSFLDAILEAGVDEPSYWEDLSAAQSYADQFSDGIIIAVDSSRLLDAGLEANVQLAECYQDDDPEMYDRWISSPQTWEDSIDFFGSAVCQSRVRVEQDDIMGIA